jgi:hypothetical protein
MSAAADATALSREIDRAPDDTSSSRWISSGSSRWCTSRMKSFWVDDLVRATNVIALATLDLMNRGR